MGIQTLKQVISICAALGWAGMMLSISGLSLATTAYVSDELFINLRTGPGDHFRILRKLRTSTAVELLEENSEAGFARVTTQGGLEGWVPLQYIQAEPTHELVRTRLQAELDQLKQQHQQLQAQYTEITGSNGQFQDTLEQVTAERDQLAEELAKLRSISQNAVTLDSDNQRLMVEVQQLSNQVESLNQQRTFLMEKSEERVMWTTVAIIAAGFLLGLITPRLRHRRKQDWS